MTDPSPSPWNALTVDVEDWYQVSAFDGVVSRGDWDRYESRVERNTETLLDLFRARNLKATFFALGWVAERRPSLLRMLRSEGHEIASHGFEHRLVGSLDPESFRADLARAASAIEAACGVRVRGYRAPSFSVSEESLWAYDVLRQEGYLFSSSVFPVRHDRYGIPSFPRFPVRIAFPAGNPIWEFPMTTWRVLGRNLPAAGGGWLRLFPAAVLAKAIRSANSAGHPAVLYVHPWEVDPGQPVVASAPRLARFRHRLNLEKTAARLCRLLDAFPFSTMSASLASVSSAPTLRLDAASRLAPAAP